MASSALGPYIALYSREVLGDVDIAALNDDQFGRLIRYWLVCSEIGGRLPGDPKEIAKRSRIDVRKVQRDLQWFPVFFVWDIPDGSWHSERLEKQALKYAKKVDSARNHGMNAHPEMGELPPLDLTPEIGVAPTPEIGVGDDPPIRSHTRGTQSQAQLKDVPPLVPPGGGKRNRRRRAESEPKPDPFVAYSPEVAKATNEVCNSCPRKDPTDGRKITVDPGKTAERIDRILKEHPKLDGLILVEAWKAYMAREPKMLKAPQYYFGEEEDQSHGLGANWFPDVKLLWHIRQKNQPPPSPSEPLAQPA